MTIYCPTAKELSDYANSYLYRLKMLTSKDFRDAAKQSRENKKLIIENQRKLDGCINWFSILKRGTNGR